jgi:NAD(P)-dependent dehydrogenase (short-subunit alcohol dehydrogenase family)
VGVDRPSQADELGLPVPCIAGGSFANKVCIVTGGASGLGKELCRQLATAGALVTLADIDETRAHAVADEIENVPGVVKVAAVDVTNSHSVQKLVDGVVAEFGRIDCMFNNAGITVWGEIRDFTLEHWRRAIEVNLIGIIHGVHYAYPIMIRQGFGHIVNTASGFGIVPSPLCGPYVTSKFAVFGLSNALRLEARGFGINVTVVCPGFVKTEMMLERMNPVNADAECVVGLIPVRMMDVQRAARLMLSGVARNKAIIVFPAYVRMFEYMFRYFPWLFNRIGSMQVSAFRRFRRTPMR